MFTLPGTPAGVWNPQGASLGQTQHRGAFGRNTSVSRGSPRPGGGEQAASDLRPSFLPPWTPSPRKSGPHAEQRRSPGDSEAPVSRKWGQSRPRPLLGGCWRRRGQTPDTGGLAARPAESGRYLQVTGEPWKAWERGLGKSDKKSGGGGHGGCPFRSRPGPRWRLGQQCRAPTPPADQAGRRGALGGGKGRESS